MDSSSKALGASSADTVVFGPRPPFTVNGFGLSDRGRKRDSNEDHFAVAELVRSLRVQHTSLAQLGTSLSAHRGYVLMIADGVGGGNAGEVASGLSVATIEDFMLNTLKRFSNLQAGEEQGALRALQEALCEADARIFEETDEHPEWRGMGTTLTMAFAVNWRLFVAHAGDSRCYLFSGGRLQQLTQDHTMTADMARRGLLPPEKIAGHPWRHVVTNALGGSEPGVQVELHSLDLHPDDMLLLCSDGLTEMMSDDEITTVLQAEHNSQSACERLIAEANLRGGKDNITVIVARVGPSVPTAPNNVAAGH